MAEIDPDMVRELLDRFYGSVRTDPLLGPVFNAIIQDAWPSHMVKVEEFWLTALRLSKNYKGAGFMTAHLRHATIHEDQIPRWLELFAMAVETTIPVPLMPRFFKVAHAMAENLRMSLRKRDDVELASPRSLVANVSDEQNPIRPLSAGIPQGC